MKKILILILLTIVITGCSVINKQSSEIKDQEIDVLQENKNCYEYKDGLEKEFTEKESDTFHESLDSIFYYQKTGSCVYVSNVIFFKMVNGEYVLENIKIRLFDFFTRELLNEARGDESIYTFTERILKE
ncbi:hypothetical protein KAJ89_04555 [Candidatus Parcubacteria bacterium]|nr:hypothetical protein [Candidatus Parcubacteria bacterium]